MSTKAEPILNSDANSSACLATTALPERLQKLFSEIHTEVGRATGKFPEWPSDPLHAFAIVAEEFGEVQKEVLQLTYEPQKSTKEALRKEAVQLAAMSMRFLLSLERYEFKPGHQHCQNR